MKKSRILVLMLAVAAAGGAFVLANSSKPAPEVAVAPAAPAPIVTDQVLVATRDLPVGTIVADGDMNWQPWPKGGSAAGMIVQEADPKAIDDIKGSIARFEVFPGEPIRREKLIKGAGSGFMSAILPSGMRAVAINIDSQGSTSAGGFILPNDRVDVVHTYQDQAHSSAGGNNPVASETILRNVRVLAIGQNVQDKNGQSVSAGSNATLELDPAQSETVILAQRVGQLSLTLRSVLDANKTDGAPADKDDKSMTIVRYGTATSGDLR